MIRSMTGFASGAGALEGWAWTWELRAVNARGLDLRLRLPEWIDGLEPALRSMLQKSLSRGSVSLNLRLGREGAETDGPDAAAIDATLARIVAVQSRAAAQGLQLAPVSALDVLGASTGQGTRLSTPDEIAALRDALLSDFADSILPPFLGMRAGEGAALGALLTEQIDQIAELTEQAATEASARRPKVEAAMAEALARIGRNAEGLDADRIAQELALLAVKSDVTEEIDRLRTHVAAARAHLSDTGPMGRKLDFLTQEFNREANTLCSKAQDPDLSATGLALKALIDQMREQVQNVE